MYFVWPWNILKWTCILIFIFREIQWSFIQFVKKSWWLKNWDLTVIFKKFLFVYLWEYIAMNLLFLNKVDDQKRYMHLFSIQSGLRNWFIVLYNKKKYQNLFLFTTSCFPSWSTQLHVKDLEIASSKSLVKGGPPHQPRLVTMVLWFFKR